MSEDVPCEYCGDEYSKQGIHAHERHCDEKPEEPPADSEGGSVFTNLTEVEQAVRERADGTCQWCEEADVQTFHDIDAQMERDTRNTVALCGDCDDELTGVHPLTKRSNVYHQ